MNALTKWNSGSVVTGLVVMLSMGSVALPWNTGAASPSSEQQVDMSLFDFSIRPQDDLYRFVNGKWLDTTEIPADKAVYGLDSILKDEDESHLRDILEQIEQDANVKEGSDEQKIRDLYTSFMNEKKLEELAAKPLQPLMHSIDMIRNSNELVGMFAMLNRQGFNSPLVIGIDQDSRDSTHYIPDLSQAGLELPDRDYYLKDGDDNIYKMVRVGYQKHIIEMFKLAGLPQPEQSAGKILKLETAIARAQWDNVVNRNPLKTYNKYEIRRFLSLAPRVNWALYLQSAGVADKSEVVNVQQPSYLKDISKLINAVPLDVWKNYLRWKIISDGSPYLSRAFADASFEFKGKMVNGVAENRPRWKRGLALVNDAIGEGLGKFYVQRYFPEENKRRITELVKSLITAYQQSIDQLDWMSDATKHQAQLKLSKLTIKVGYPDRWRDYSALSIIPDDLWGNVIHASEFEYQRQLNKLGKPVDHSEWLMTPQTLNAYYDWNQNEIVFPAAILQPPYFDVHSDDACNYGGIGSVIGHEISHGFDDQGSQYDGDGNLKGWWTEEDHKKFIDKTRRLIAQYDAYEPVAGHHVNGKLTLGENIADLSGLSIAYKAYQLSLHGQPSPVIGSFTGEQRFFLCYAVTYREKVQDKYAIKLIASDPHSPANFRVLGTVINLDAFYRAFDVKPGDKMYLPPEKRISIW